MSTIPSVKTVEPAIWALAAIWSKEVYLDESVNVRNNKSILQWREVGYFNLFTSYICKMNGIVGSIPEV